MAETSGKTIEFNGKRIFLVPDDAPVPYLWAQAADAVLRVFSGEREVPIVHVPKKTDYLL